MPHLVILYTPQLDRDTDMGVLCRKLADTMIAQRDESGKAVFPVGGTRVLAYPAAHFAVADGGAAARAQGKGDDCAFAYFNLRMGRGRSEAVKKRAGEALVAVAREHLAPVLAQPSGRTDLAGRRRARGVRRQVRQPASAVRQMTPTLDDRTISALAKQLYDARKSRTQLRHFSKQHPSMTIDDGYAIQRAWVKLEQADGHRIVGRKIGLTSRAMQQSSQIDEPDFAPLMSDMVFAAGGDIPIERFIAPRVEVELAFILGKPLKGPGATLFDVLAATEVVTPAIEIIDARIEQFDRDTKQMRKVFDTISDFAANAGIVMGGRPVRPHDVDLRWVGALLHKNGVVEETGLAAGVLNHPANGVAWLANKIAPYGESLEAGADRARRLVHAAGERPSRRHAARRLRAPRKRRLPLRVVGSVAFRLV